MINILVQNYQGKFSCDIITCYASIIIFKSWLY